MPWKGARQDAVAAGGAKAGNCVSGYRASTWELQPEVVPKSPSGAAVRYALNQWEVLTRFLEDGELEIDNGATERANRDIALGRGNWTFFGSDGGGKTAAVLRSFIASCKRCGVEPFAWFPDVLARIPPHSITRPTNCFPTSGNGRLPLPKLNQSADTIHPGPTRGRAVYETHRTTRQRFTTSATT